MAIVGYNSIGALQFAAGSGNGTNNATGLLIIMPEAGSITKITAYVATTVTGKNIACRIYAGSAGSRGALLATTNTSAVTTSFQWLDFTFTSPYSASATTYWLQFDGYGGDGPGTAVGQIKYDTGGAANSGYDLLDNGIPQYETNQYSIYATYTPTATGGFNIALV